MASIREIVNKKGKKTFHVEIRVKGYKPLRASFTRKSDAQIWIGENESKMKRGKKIKINEASKHTLGELINRYIEYELPQRKSDKGKFIMQLNWWNDKIGHHLLSDVTPSLLSQYKDVLSKEPSPKLKSTNSVRSNATINRYMACLSIVLTKASKEWEWMEENPMLKVAKKKEPRGRIRFLSEDERKALLENCKADSKELYLLVLIAISTGARYSEIANLKWSNIDFKSNLFYFMDTKNGENRGVPISSIVLSELKAFSKVRNIKSNYVFAKADSQAIFYFNDRFRNVVKKSNLDDFKFHDLRHTAASYLAMNGASLLDIAEILGHKTLQMVKRYSHFTKKHTADLIERMNTKELGG